MKKLNELSFDELKKLYNNNNDFSVLIYEKVYENNMFWQEDLYYQFFGKNRDDGVKHNSHYTSFYLTISDAEKFWKNIRETLETDYLTDEAKKVYESGVKIYEKWENMTWDEQEEDDGGTLWDEMETEAKKLLEYLESDLHQFENITDADIDNYLQAIIDDAVYMGDFETDGEKVFENITKVYA